MTRLHLICHGMMLFKWDGGDSFTILIHELPDHTIALSEQPGAPAGTDLLQGRRGDFDLKVTKAGTKPHYVRADSYFEKPDPNKDVVLNFDKLPAAYKHQPLSVDHYHAALRITLPYPTRVHRGRVVKRDPNRDPAFYKKGQATEAFRVNKDPDAQPPVELVEVAGCHILTYEDASQVQLLRHSTQMYNETLTGDRCLKLYLYAQQESTDDMGGGHIDKFDLMVSYFSSNIPPVRYTLDLDGDDYYEKPTVDKYGDLDPGDLPGCLTPGDFNPLPCYRGEICLNDRIETRLVGDPVECLQGWGT